MASMWRKIVDLPTGETLEIKVHRIGGEVKVAGCIAHGLFEHDGLEVFCHVPLKVRPGGWDFNVDILPKA